MLIFHYRTQPLLNASSLEKRINEVKIILSDVHVKFANQGFGSKGIWPF